MSCFERIATVQANPHYERKKKHNLAHNGMGNAVDKLIVDIILCGLAFCRGWLWPGRRRPWGWRRPPGFRTTGSPGRRCQTPRCSGSPRWTPAPWCRCRSSARWVSERGGIHIWRLQRVGQKADILKEVAWIVDQCKPGKLGGWEGEDKIHNMLQTSLMDAA